MTARFFGQRVRRFEDPRLLRGQGSYLDDLRLPGERAVVFVRSPHAHARIRGIDGDPALAQPGMVAVIAAGDLGWVRRERLDATVTADASWHSGGGIEGASGHPDHAHTIAAVVPHPALRPCAEPPLATSRVRYVGEPVAAVVATDVARARDAAESVRVDYEPLLPVPDADAAVAAHAPLLHPHLGDNLAADFTVRVGEADAAFAHAEVITRERYDVQRYSGMPLETRGVAAQFDPGTGQLTVWSSTQWPHTVRDALRKLLRLAEHRVRVIAPDVGGGFGIKQEVYPEEVVLALLAMRLRVPVRWIETRGEHLLAAVHAREQQHTIELAARRDGTLLGLRADILCDQGAYTRSLGVLCPSLTAAGLPGPYRIRDYTCQVRAALTCKAPAAAYRGAGQPEAVFAIERAMDHLARELGLDPAEVRRRNFIRPDEFPWEVGTESAQTPITYDSGDYEASLDRAMALSRYGERRAEQARERARGCRGRLLGLGLASFVFLTGLGPFEGAVVRVDASGKVLLITGSSPHGQGTATALAQIVADELGLAPAEVTVSHGDTAQIPFGVGTYASRNAVVAGNAAAEAARAVRAKARKLAAHLLEVDEADLELAGGAARVVGAPDRRIALADLAAAFAPGASLPAGLEPSLEATHYFPAPRPSFASGVHVAWVEVDRETGRVDVLDYCVVNDSGRLINPLIAEGQIHGGVAQGVGGALYESLVYDGEGQLLSQSWLDYTLPRATQIPAVRIAHLETLSPLNPLGVKGVGEGGAMAPPPAIAAAVEDALTPFGARVTRTPLTPESVFRLLQRA